MKKFLLIIILGFFMAISANAQIQRKFFDFQLGLSTKTEMTNHFKARGNNVRYLDNTIAVDDVIFGGMKWNEFYADYYKNKLYRMYFLISSYSKDKLDTMWDILNRRIGKKYASYYVNSKSSEKEKWYYDGKTVCNLKYEYEDKWYLAIIYFDEKMYNQKNDEEENEL